MKRTTMKRGGLFCKLFGSTPRNRIIELFLESRECDYSVSDIAELTGMIRMTTHNNVKKLAEEGVLIRSRVVGGTQLLKLDIENPLSKAYITTFDNALMPFAKSDDAEGILD